MTDPSTKKRHGPQPVTRDRLHNAALRYLERFATSSENLRRVLMRHVDRSAMLHGTDRDAGAEWVNAIVARFEELGVLDDKAYAEMRAQSLRRQGTSEQGIRLRLIQKGVDGDIIDNALDDAGDDFTAAVTYARKRRLGPYRTKDREGRRDRDLAALGRVGFDYETAQRIVNADTIEELELECRQETTDMNG